MKHNTKIIIAVLLGAILLSKSSYAYDNRMIHPFVLTGKALELLALRLGSKMEYYKELNSYFYIKNEMPDGYHNNGNYDKTVITKTGTLGSIIEDEGTRPANHFFNPYNPPDYEAWWGFLPGVTNALSFSKPLWKEAFSEYAKGNKDIAYQKLGQVCHLLEDMGSPPHVHGDFHVFGSLNYESWILPKSNLEDEETKKRLAYFDECYRNNNPQIAAITSYDDAFKTLAAYTYDAARIKGSLNKDKAKPASGDFGVMFGSGAVSYYVREAAIFQGGMNLWKIPKEYTA
jgi:hypothetical protein